MNNEAKRLYERIKLTGYTPTEQELKIIEGTVWHSKLHGTKPHSTPETNLKFKAYFEDGVPAEKPVMLLQSDIAEYLVDNIEKHFDVHFSNENLGIIDISKLPKVKQYALNLLNNIETSTWAKNHFIGVINNSKEPNDLLIQLSMAAS